MCKESELLIPNLNLSKSEDAYLLKSNKGKLSSDNTNITFDIECIEINIGDNIHVNFKMPIADFNNFNEKIIGNDIKPFLKFNNFSIKCKTEEYSILLSNFVDTKDYLHNEYWQVSGLVINVKLVKNNLNSFNASDQVEVWDILEPNNIFQPFSKKFEISSAPPIYLKSQIPEGFTIPNDLSESITEQYLMDEKNSFSQLLNQKSFLFYKTEYKGKFPSIISDIENLLFFYTYNICPTRMKIIKGIDNEKLEITISQNKNLTLKAEHIFSDNENNFVKFINSSFNRYRNEINLKDFNINLLIYYYVRMKNEINSKVKIVLCSEFFEVLKNIVKEPEKDEKNKLYERINQRLDYLDIDRRKILEKLQPDIYRILINIKKKCNQKKGFNPNKVHTLWLKLTETYVTSIVVFYRNRIVHAGKYEMDEKVKDLFIEFWMEKFVKGLSNFPEEILDFTVHNLQNELYKTQIFDVRNQCIFLENFIEIILLRLLRADCNLDKEYRLLSINQDDNLNSKYLVDNFLK